MLGMLLNQIKRLVTVNLKRWILFSSIFILHFNDLSAQEVLKYGPNDPIAKVHYNEFLYGIYKTTYDGLPAYPIKGAYSPSHYARPSAGILPGSGVCNYIYIPTSEALLPGQQYKLRLEISLGSAYEQVPYFKSHLGIALTSDLFNNYFGLWRTHYVPLNIEVAEELVSLELVFRPLCTSKYLVLGVFQGEDMDPMDCFACQYGIELFTLDVEVYNSPTSDFVYLCDAFEGEGHELEGVHYPPDTIFFDSGSSIIHAKYDAILDSIPFRLRTKQDLIRLYAYTDMEGSDNEALGVSRVFTVIEALAARGIDTSRILGINYGESMASDRVRQFDRRVEIVYNSGFLYQKHYTEALKAAAQGDYGMAKIRISKWAKLVPPEDAIFALFDCWGKGTIASHFKADLLRFIRERAYPKEKDLQFKFDSLYCEDQRNRTLGVYIGSNRLPGYQNSCLFDIDSSDHFERQGYVDELYRRYGFPAIEQVGVRGNRALPYMILHIPDTAFQCRYLPLVRRACEEQKINWEMYAMLYDKISIVRCGRQRYGTQWRIEDGGRLTGLYLLEDVDMVSEYRKQVGLSPLSDF